MRCDRPYSRHSRWRLRIAWTAIALLSATAVHAGARPEVVLPQRVSCDGEHVQVTLGLPIEYAPPKFRATLDAGPDAVSLCASFAGGNPYELLSWLENGSLRAVVLPAFAVAVLRADDPDKFARDYVEFAPSPVSLLTLKQRTVELVSANGEPASAAALATWFATLAGNDQTLHGAMVLPHHLSEAVREYFRRATEWADAQQLTGEQRERFMARVVAAIRFQAVRNSTPQSLSFIERTDDGLDLTPVDALRRNDSPLRTAASDRLVVRRQLLANLPKQLSGESKPVAISSKAAPPLPPSKTPKSAALFQDTLEAESRMGEAVKQFRAANYQRYADGSISRRYFRFLVPELWRIFAARDAQFAASGDAGDLALVLTGGGVKAAYQTQLIDRLYAPDKQDGAVRLVNAAHTIAAEAGDSRTPQRVEYIIGTSGGALLGMFVGALNPALLQSAQWQGLADLLWRPGGELKSWQVFPLLDMLRYFSILVCFWVLWLTMTVGVRFFGERWLTHVRAGSPQHAAIVEQRVNRRIVRWKSESLPWIVLLGAAPIVVVMICNRQGLEHVPPVAGIFYTAMAVIAWFADVNLSPTRHFAWRQARVPKTFLALAVVGVACIAIPASGDWIVDSCKSSLPWQVNLCFTGFLLLAVALYAFFAHQRDYFRREPWQHGVGMLLGIVAMVALSYLVVWVGVAFKVTAFLELTGSFWLWLLPTMVALSALLLALGHVAEGQTPHTPAQRAVGYMFGEHTSRAFLSGHRRYTRFVVLATLSWCWWNALVAPGLYGNCDANEYFEQTYRTFAKEAVGDEFADFPLSVPFVVTATSLEKNQERYFLFVREGAQQASLSDQAWFNVASDGRWITVRDYTGSHLRAAAFASGSPFPVFSSHQVELPKLRLEERLIDGGFAHNKPLDAARALGASKVLVLNSSPLDATVANGDCALFSWLKLGELSCNLPKLLPYLWSRSQVEDSLSSAQMLVASIYPTGDDGSDDRSAWPMLTDFRGAVVDRMIAAADYDLRQRIGTIESWGAPQLSDAYVLPVSQSSVARALKR